MSAPSGERSAPDPAAVGARHRSLRDEVVDELRRSILNGVYESGSRLTETAVAARLEVSRLPVREAFRRLEAEGLLEPLPRKGVRVAVLDPLELETVREVRLQLELLAVRITTERADAEIRASLEDLHRRGLAASEAGSQSELDALNDEFHELLAVGAGSRFLVETLRAARNQAHRLVGGRSGAVMASWDEHTDILESVLDGDAELAVLKMKRHITARHLNQGGPIASAD